MARDPTQRSERAADGLRQIVSAVTHRLRAESEGYRRSPSELAVLKRLQTLGPSTTAALARAEWVKPQSMGATLSALEKAGFVARKVDRTDARCRNVSLTAEGRRILAAGRAARQNWLARAIDETLDGEEQRTLLTAIELLRRVIAS